MRLLPNKKGNLVVAVALAATLVLVSIFWSSLRTYRQKAQQTEARRALSQLVAAEFTGFSETGRFSDDLTKLGFFPPASFHYAIGFNPRCLPPSSAKRGIANSRGRQSSPLIAALFEELPCSSRSDFFALAVALLDEKIDAFVARSNGEVSHVTLIVDGGTELKSFRIFLDNFK